MRIRPAQRYINVQTALTRRLAQPLGAEPLEHLANGLSRLDHFVKSDVLGIEIENEIVGPIECRQARAPGIQLDAAEVCQINQGGFVLADEIADRLSLRGARWKNDGLDPFRRRLTAGVLLKKALSLDAVGVAMERLGAVA